MMAKTARLASFCVFASAGALGADNAPLSAIDWLSDSIATPAPETAPFAPEKVDPPSVITVTPLGSPGSRGRGLISAERLGMQRDLWGRSASRDLASMIAALPDGASGPPSLRRFLRDLMVGEFDAPVDAGVDQALFLARLDRLLAMGHLEAAQALIHTDDVIAPESFRRAFDIALLRGTESEACNIIEETPDISPTYPARVFCLARNGKWDVAALTFGNAEALGILSERENKLLLHFLEPELYEVEAVPSPPRIPSPLQFRLYEAVGERISTDQLPVAFAVADLADTVGWKARLLAVERLAAVDAVPVSQLVDVYLERKSAASGEIWDRVDAVQGLVRGLNAAKDDEVETALPRAWKAAQRAGYGAGFAAWVAPQLGKFDLDGSNRHIAFELALLASDAKLAGKFVGKSAEDRFLLALAEGSGAALAVDPLSRAVLRGLGALGPGQRYFALINDGRSGEALLRALSVLMDGAAGNPEGVAEALALLRALGLKDLARQVGVELVLMEGAA